MKTLTIVLSSLSVLMLLSTLICGSWLRAKGADPEGISFHIKLAIPTVILTLISLALLIARVVKG
jgi:hypothetical protein